jgi:hypothetical protein
MLFCSPISKTAHAKRHLTNGTAKAATMASFNTADLQVARDAVIRVNTTNKDVAHLHMRITKLEVITVCVCVVNTGVSLFISGRFAQRGASKGAAYSGVAQGTGGCPS